MRLGLREQMQEIDRRSSSEHGLSEEALMERAGQLMTESLLSLPGLDLSLRIGIFCGPGHNGGDGLVVARKLFEKGFKFVEVWRWPSENSTSSLLFELNQRRFKDLGGTIKTLDSDSQKNFDFNKFGLFIDALFGTGLNRPMSAELCRFIQRINRQRVSIVSLDVPSGLDVNTGKTWGACVRAIKTLTCGLAKPGFYLQEGPDVVGGIEVLNIGFPPELVRRTADSTFLIGQNSARKLLPQRRPQSNKSHFGKLLILAGKPGMKGAAELAAIAAARMGVGYVVVSSPFGAVLRKMPPDFLQIQWRDLSRIDFKSFSAVAIGPGLGTGSETLQLLKKLQNLEKVLVDADAITVAARHQLWPLPSSWVLTPHAGEMSRIIPWSAKEIEEDRLGAVHLATQVTGASVLLKGFHSVFGFDKKNYIIASGNAALAKAGTGDVLTGFIASLMAQGLATDRATVLGAYLHGRIADDWIRSGGDLRTLMASDLPRLLHRSLKILNHKS